MNHPKGEESTSAGERCSNCPQQLCTAAEPSPQELRHCGGGGHLRERNLCGGFCSFFFGRNLRSRANGTAVTRGALLRLPLSRLSVRLRRCRSEDWAERSRAFGLRP